MSFFKQVLVLVVLCALGYGGYRAWQHYGGVQVQAESAPGKSRRARSSPTVETVPAAVRDLETRVEAVGSTRARRAVEVTPLAPGRITEIDFHAGKRVATGAVLLRLDDDIQRADLVEAKARLAEARSALDRARSLKRTSSVADETVERQVAALATAQANHDRTARRLRDRTVTAPFAGTVGFSRVELGGRIEDGDMVTTLDDLSSVEIEFSLPESLFGRIAVGQRVVADAAAFPKRSFTGTVEAIDSRIDAIGRSFKARALVSNPDRLLPAGMFMHLAVVLEARRGLTVPEEAVVVAGEQAFVFIVTKGEEGERAARRDVTLGQRSFGFVEILAGLEEHDEVVVRGVQRVRDGGPVSRGSGAGGAGARQGKEKGKGKGKGTGGSKRQNKGAGD